MSSVRGLRVTLIFLSFFAGTLSYAGEKPPRVFRGELDLRTLKPDSIFAECAGEWKFEPGVFSVSGPGSNAEPALLSVPGPWKLKSRMFSNRGFGTYRLKVFLPSAGNYALELSEVASSYRLYVNGIFLGSEGEAGRIPAKAWVLGSRWYFLPRDTNRLDIAVEVANWNFKDGGFLVSPRIGRTELLIRSRESRSLLNMLLIGILLTVGVYHMGHFLLNRKEKASHYLGFFSFLSAVRIFVVEKIFVSQYLASFPYEWVYRIDALTIFLSVSTLIIYFHYYFDGIVSLKTGFFISIPGYLFAAVALILPASNYSCLMNLFFYVIYAAGLYCIWLILAAGRRKRPGVLMTLLGFVLLFFFVVNDTLDGQHIIHTAHLVPLGMLIFIMGQTLLQMIRFTNAYREVEISSIELERKVEDRTVDLQREQKKLLQQNRMMLEELRLAQKIQKQYIPKKSPSSKVAFYYKPMEQLGGDFFDFVELPDGRLGLFLSDVSGHGVPAAFITSMIKSFMLQYRDLITDPAELLIALNDFLFQFTGGQFVTAFYGIYDPETRCFLYANAGHHSPYLIREGAPWYLSHEARGIPIAVLSTKDLQAENSLYKNMFLELPGHSKLFLFTDGLTEAVNIDERQQLPESMVADFETRDMIGAMMELSGLPASDFVEEMVARLVAYRGGTEFDDDVCLICMEVD